MRMAQMTIERDVAVPMRDGLRLLANLYRPAVEAPCPVIMSVTPYGKDKGPDRVTNFFMRLSGVKFGKLNCSRLTGFESPDPVYWVQQGYAVVQADVRGKYKSEGQAGVLRQQDAEDYYDLIEWRHRSRGVPGESDCWAFRICACRNGMWLPSSHRICARSFRGRVSRTYIANWRSMAGYRRRDSFGSGSKSESSAGAIADFRWLKISWPREKPILWTTHIGPRSDLSLKTSRRRH